MRFFRLAVAGSALLVLAGCSTASPLAAELTEVTREAQATTLTLSSLESVDGSEFLVVCPYESADYVERRLGFGWVDAPDYSARDDVQTVAVIDEGEVTAHAELPRDEVDFCAAGQWPVLPVDSDLTLTRSGHAVQVSASI